nr:RIR1-Ano fusion protein [synthetic construct]
MKIEEGKLTNPGVSAWQVNTAYTAGQLVTYNGKTYKCLQPHTSLAGWEPSNVPALWQLQNNGNNGLELRESGAVSGDTIVMTSGGPRTVAELEGKPFTALIRGSGYPCPSGFFRTCERDVYDLRTREGHCLRLTHDHRVLVMDGGLEWRAAGELERGDRLVMDDAAGEFPALATFRGLRGAGRQDVYDATVYGASAFTANGFIVHNAPQYAPGDEPSYDEDTDDSDKLVENDTSITDEDYAAIEASLSETFNTAADPGRRLGEGSKP